MRSALLSAARAEEIGLKRDRIILSAKVSSVQDLITVYRMLGRALRLRAASGPDRSRHGLEGHRRLVRGARRPAAGRAWRHDPHFAHPRAGRRPDAGSQGRAGTAADHGVPQFRAAGRRLSRLRAHDLDRVPGAGARHRDLSRQVHAGMARGLSGRRAAERRGDGLHRQRAGREQARQYRHLAARNRRSAGRAGVRRRGQDRHPSRARASPRTSRRWSTTISRSATGRTGRRRNRGERR